MTDHVHHEIAVWLTRRNEALRTLDIAWAREQFPSASSDEVLLASLHKARYDCRALADELRLESGEWLRARGLGAMQGRDLEAPGELPR